MKLELPPLLVNLRRRLILAYTDAESENAQIDDEGSHQQPNGVLLEQTLETESVVLLKAIDLAYKITKRDRRRPNYN